MDSAEVDLEVLGRMELIVGHLQLYPRTIEPSCEVDGLLLAVGVRE